METKSDCRFTEGKEKEKEDEEEIEIISTDFDFEDYEESLDSFIVGEDKLSIFSGFPLLLLHEKISCGASASWWLPLTEFESSITVEFSIPRSSYVFLGVAVSQVYLRLKNQDDEESIILSRQLSTIIGREFSLIWTKDGLPDCSNSKLDICLNLMELSIVCASVSWAVLNVEDIVVAANDALPEAEWDSHTYDMRMVLWGLKKSLEKAVDTLCTSEFGQESALYRESEVFH